MASPAILRALEEENARLRERLRRLDPGFAAQPTLTIELLGAPRVVLLQPGSAPAQIAWRLRRARRVLALLALSPGRRATREEIVQAFWPEADAAKVRRNLHPTLHELRRALAEAAPGLSVLLSAAGTYSLNPELEWKVDAVEFDRLSASGRQLLADGNAAGAVGEWTLALGLYRGPFLAGDDDQWAEGRRERYRERRVALLQALGALHERRGDLEQALDAYRLSLAEEPLQEELHLALLRVYARQGRRDLVRRHFDRFSRLLLEELGVEPSFHAAEEYQRLMANAGGG